MNSKICIEIDDYIFVENIERKLECLICASYFQFNKSISTWDD